MLEVIRPELYEMSFREYLMADEMTMSYNAKWGHNTISQRRVGELEC